MWRRAILVATALAVAALVGGGMEFLRPTDASANQCANACYAAHNQCRIAKKGAPTCDAQLSRCLSSCGRR